MTETQKDAVRQSWALVVPIAETAATLFYDRLFEIDPSTGLLFKADGLPEQRRKLIRTLDQLVLGLDRLDDLAPVIAELGRRHLSYGVRESHYESVGAALLWTLEHGLGNAWTPRAREAWSAVYALTAGIMLTAARDAASAAWPAPTGHGLRQRTG